MGLFFALLIELIWLKHFIDTKNKEIKALSIYSNSLFESNQKLDALIESIRSGRRLNNLWFKNLGNLGINSDTKMRVLLALNQTVYSLKEPQQFSANLNQPVWIRFSPEHQTFAALSQNKTFNLWRLDGTLKSTFTLNTEKISSLCLSQDAQMIVSGSESGKIKIWDNKGKLLLSLKTDKSQIASVSWSPDGQMLASASKDGNIQFWQKSQGESITTNHQTNFHLKSYAVNEFLVTHLSWSPNSQMLASADVNGKIKIWHYDGWFKI